MFTYVINTSENRTFDNDLLFRLSGYNKIRWMECKLNNITDCIKEISDRQNVLGADDYRVAVIIDFYPYDRIRAPYGMKGYVEEEGVDMSLYLPYIEAYLTDKFINELIGKEIPPSSFEVYYAHSGDHHSFSVLANEREQIRQILFGKEETAGEISPKDLEEYEYYKSIISDAQKNIEDFDIFSEKVQNEKTEEYIRNKKKARLVELNTLMSKKGYTPLKNLSFEHEKLDITLRKKKPESLTEEEIRLEARRIELELEDERRAIDYMYDLMPYGKFTLYCTKELSLDFGVVDYPYGTPYSRMTYIEFFDAFVRRVGMRSFIKRHFFKTSLGGGPSKSAFDTLSLSLYLIRLYEREEDSPAEDLEIPRISPKALKETLIESLSKVASSRKIALINQSKYYALEFNEELEGVVEEDVKELTEKEAILKEKRAIPDEIAEKRMSPEKMYDEIGKYVSKTDDGFTEEDRKEFDKIMCKYLHARDDTREQDVQVDLENVNTTVAFKTTDQCPSRDEFEYVVDKRKKRISKLFDKTLKSDFIQVDYSEERQRSTEIYNEYCKVKACIHKNILGDVVFLILVLLAMYVPYQILQLRGLPLFGVQALPLILTVIGIFAGLFVLAVILQMLPLVRKLKNLTSELRECYIDCLAKRNYSFSALKRRYEEDLIAIEEERYELRQIRTLYEANVLIEKHVTMHREMLEKVQDRISSMLNNLDVEAIIDADDAAPSELDISKSFIAKENKIYQIFSLDTIENMFLESRS